MIKKISSKKSLIYTSLTFVAFTSPTLYAANFVGKHLSPVAQNPAFSATVSATQNTQWWSNVTVTFTNTSSVPQSIANAVIQFQAPYANAEVNRSMPVYPNLTVTSTADGNNYDYTVTVSHPDWQTEDQFKKTEVIQPGKSFTITFGGPAKFNDMAGQHISIATGRTKTDGRITLNDGAKPADLKNNKYPTVVLTEANQKVSTIKFSAWNQTKTLTGLAEPAVYALTPQPINDASGDHFTATKISPINVTSATAVKESIQYTQQIKHNGEIALSLPQKPNPALANELTATITDVSANKAKVAAQQKVAWGKTTPVMQLIPGDHYQVTVSPAYYVDANQVIQDSLTTSAGNVIAATAVSKANTINFNNKITPLPTANVNYKITVPAGISFKQTAASLTFTGSKAGYPLSLTETAKLGATSSLVLPLNVPFNVAAENLQSTDGNTYTANIADPEITPTSSGKTETITYSKNAGKLVVGYWPNWEGLTGMPAAADHGYNVLVIAFGQINGTKASLLPTVDPCTLSTCDGKPPEPNDADLPHIKQYLAAIKKAHPNLKILLSFGGANNQFMPSTNPTDAKTIAESIYTLLGEMGIDGIDFDIETPGYADTMDNILQQLKQAHPSVITTAAPQLNDARSSDGDGSTVELVSTSHYQDYDKAIKHGGFDYLFVQEYNTPTFSIGNTCGAKSNKESVYSEQDTGLISASYCALDSYINKLHPAKFPKIITGEPAAYSEGYNADIQASSGLFYHYVGNFAGAMIAINQQLGLLVNAKHFGGIMTWNAWFDQQNNWIFVTGIK